MNLVFPTLTVDKDALQNRLLVLAAVFVGLFALILTLSPAVRVHSWNAEYRWQHWIGAGVWAVGYALLHRQTVRYLPNRDPYILPIVALLTGWGLLTIWRLDPAFGLRQTIWLALGIAVVWFGVRYPQIIPQLRKYKYLLLFSGLALTALTFVFGVYPQGDGPRLWLGCCGVYLQPSEPLKLLLIIFLAAYLADRMPIVFDLNELLAPTLVMVGAAAALLVAQRDLGTTSLIIILYALILYIASGKRRILVVFGIFLLAISLGGYLLFDVIQARVNTWLNPWLDPTGSSFQIVQSLLAFASGGMIGAGPGLGSPGLVPVAHSDFVAAAIAEETGLLGLGGLLILFGLLAIRGFRIAIRATNNYRRFLAAGIIVHLVVQTILIIGGNIRLLPLTGVTLPFVSYGGSSLLTVMAAVLILLLVSDSNEEEPAPFVQHRSFIATSSLLLLGLFCVAVLAGWWSFGAADMLRERADNARWLIDDRFVPRGILLDQQNRPLVITEGEPGSYRRTILYPPLGNVLGYSHSLYGQAGAEAALNPYLRGLEGVPSGMIWSSYILYNQRPNGLTVRLSLDLDIQQRVDPALEGKTGSAVLLNARTGEILAMSSHPGYNPNELDERWPQLIEDPDSPLVNRATQGQYPLGTAIGPFMLARVLRQGELPEVPTRLNFHLDNQQLECAIDTDAPAAWSEAVQNGCPGAMAVIGRSLSTAQFQELFQQLGFTTAPNVDLPVAQPTGTGISASTARSAVGLSPLRVTPLQVGLAAASLSNAGVRPGPRLAMAILTPDQGWVILPAASGEQVFDPAGVERAVELLASDDMPIWETVASTSTEEEQISWYLAGTLPQWQGTPLSMALVLENATAAEARETGRAILRDVLQPDN